jgi:hypothetical protein
MKHILLLLLLISCSTTKKCDMYNYNFRPHRVIYVCGNYTYTINHLTTCECFDIDRDTYIRSMKYRKNTKVIIQYIK